MIRFKTRFPSPQLRRFWRDTLKVCSSGLGGAQLSSGALLLLVAFAPHLLSAQVPKKVVTEGAFKTTSVHAADLDGNGNPEVLYGAFGGMQGDGLLAWHKNQLGEGGSGTGGFGVPKRLLDLQGKKYLTTADLDGDGDEDVAAGFFSHLTGTNKISWFENRIGSSGVDFDGFAEEKEIATDVDGVMSLTTADIDGDGGPDVVFASAFDNKIGWLENRVGESEADSDGFSPQRTITENVQEPLSVASADVDGDGDQDVITYSNESGRIALHENQTGEGQKKAGSSWASETIMRGKRESNLADLTVADLDGDGDKDILTDAAWYENKAVEEGREGKEFGSRNPIAASDDAYSVVATDLDGDGDKDLLVGGFGRAVWHENQIGERGSDADGFGPEQQIFDENYRGASIAVYAADLDGDGDNDVIANGISQKIYWFENTPEWTSSQE